MFQDTYVKLDKLETEDLLGKISSCFDGGKFDPAATVVMTRPLPFYPGYQFLDISDHTQMPALRRFAVMKSESEVVVLDFTNVPIYKLNGEAPVTIDDENVYDYTRFFFSFVRGRHGRFQIVESVDDINWREDPPPAARKAVGKMIGPLSLIEKEESGVWHLKSQMIFRDSLFQANIEVQPGGLVKLSNEQLLIEDMPVMDDTFGQ